MPIIKYQTKKEFFMPAAKKAEPKKATAKKTDTKKTKKKK